MNNKVKWGALATLVVSAVFSASAFAATANFSGNLPANQGDTEISTVARANAANVVTYFSVKVTSIATGYTAVRAFTETPGGTNLSDPYREMAANSAWHTESYYASDVPDPGDNVILNLDNPVITSSTVAVAGQWSPN